MPAESSNLRSLEDFLYKTADANKISLQKKKTQIYTFKNHQVINMNTEKESHIDYLGFLFDGQKVRIRNKSIYKFYRKAYRLIDRAKKVKKNKNIKKFHIGAKYIIFTQIWVPIRMGKHMETSFYMPTMHKKFLIIFLRIQKIL